MMDVIKPSESCILKVWQLDDGIYLKQEDRLLRICPQTESAIRVSYTDQESFSPEQGKEYENSFENVKYLKWKWEDRLHEIIIATQKAFVSVDKAIIQWIPRARQCITAKKIFFSFCFFLLLWFV